MAFDYVIKDVRKFNAFTAHHAIHITVVNHPWNYSDSVRSHNANAFYSYWKRYSLQQWVLSVQKMDVRRFILYSSKSIWAHWLNESIHSPYPVYRHPLTGHSRGTLHSYRRNEFLCSNYNPMNGRSRYASKSCLLPFLVSDSWNLTLVPETA